MTDLNRRSFIKQTSLSGATLGLLSSLPALAVISDSPQATMPETPHAAFSGPVIAHVTDVSRGEVALLVGAREIIFRDPALVARLMKAAG